MLEEKSWKNYDVLYTHIPYFDIHTVHITQCRITYYIDYKFKVTLNACLLFSRTYVNKCNKDQYFMHYYEFTSQVHIFRGVHKGDIL